MEYLMDPITSYSSGIDIRNTDFCWVLLCIGTFTCEGYFSCYSFSSEKVK